MIFKVGDRVRVHLEKIETGVIHSIDDTTWSTYESVWRDPKLDPTIFVKLDDEDYYGVDEPLSYYASELELIEDPNDILKEIL